MKKSSLLAYSIMFAALAVSAHAADFGRPRVQPAEPAGAPAASAACAPSGGDPAPSASFNDRVAEFNPEIGYLKNELLSAEKAAGAESKDLPLVLDAEGEKLTGSDSGEKNYSTKNIELSKTYEVGRGPGIKKSRGRLELEIKKCETERAVNDVLYDANISALQLIKSFYVKKLSDGNRAIASATVDAVDKKYEVSLASRLEVEQARIDYEVQVIKNLEVSGAFENEKKVFAIKNGARAAAFIEMFREGVERSGLTGEIAVLGRSAGIALPGCEELCGDALARRLDRKAAAAEAELYRVLIELENRSNSPELKLGLFRSVNDVKETERGVRFGLSLPIYDFGRRSSAVEALEIKLNGPAAVKPGVNYGVANVENRILADVTEKYGSCSLQREKLKALSGAVLNRASAIFEMAAVGYREGATSLFEYQTAKKNYFEFYEGLISALVDYNVSLLQLRRACGFPPRDNGDVMNAFFSARDCR